MKLFVHATGLLAAAFLGAVVAIISILPIDMDKSPGGWFAAAIVLAGVMAFFSLFLVQFERLTA